MAYYTGTVNSFADLKAVIEGAATDTGWTLLDGSVLSKYGHFVQLAAGMNSGYPFMSVQSATAQSGGILAGQVSRGAKVYSASNLVISWPSQFFIHAFDREFYCFLKSNVNLYQCVAFGVSDMPGIGGTGGWHGAMADIQQRQNTSYDGTMSFYISNENTFIGRPNDGTFDACLASPFWASSPYQLTSKNSEIHIGIDSTRWESPGNLGVSSVSALLVSQPNLFNNGHILVPIKSVVARPDGGRTIVLAHNHIRWMRNDLVDDEEIIEYGPDRWKCYPVFRKNVNQRNGTAAGRFWHSGTIAYAVRYDGP